MLNIDVLIFEKKFDKVRKRNKIDNGIDLTAKYSFDKVTLLPFLVFLYYEWHKKKKKGKKC